MKRAYQHSRCARTNQKRAGGPICPAHSMPLINPYAGGIDVGATEHYVCVPADAVPTGALPVRCFGTFTRDLAALVEWLQKCGVKTVALESTGVYWIPLYEKLEAAGIRPLLVNARHLHQVPGRKTDVKDCQWIQQLHSYGLLNGSFRPTGEICHLRTLLRHRGNLIGQRAEQVQHMQRAFQQMNILLHHVVSDLDGDTGLRILDAILEGQRDPKELVKLRDSRIKKSTVEEMEAALTGEWRPEQLLVLKQARAIHKFLETQMRECDQAILEQLKNIPTAPPPPPVDPDKELDPQLKAELQRLLDQQKAQAKEKPKRKRRAGGNEPVQDFLPELNRICGIDLTQIGGLNMLSILMLVSELGTDMSPWRSSRAFSAWMGVAPGNKKTGGRIISTRTPYVASRVATLLRTLAVTIGRTDTWLGSFHRRMKARLGPAGAATATARKLACVIYHLLKNKEPYVNIDRALYEAKVNAQRIKWLRKQAEQLGFQVIENPQLA